MILNILYVLYCNLYIFFGEMAVQMLCTFFNLGCLFSYYWVLRVPYVFRVKISLRYDLQKFSSSLLLVFSLAKDRLSKSRSFKFQYSTIVTFFLLDSALSISFKYIHSYTHKYRHSIFPFLPFISISMVYFFHIFYF